MVFTARCAAAFSLLTTPASSRHEGITRSSSDRSDGRSLGSSRHSAFLVDSPLMAVTYKGEADGTFGAAASGVPTLPAFAARDICFFLAGQNVSLQFSITSGWTVITNFSSPNQSTFLAYRVMQAGDTAPTLSWGVASTPSWIVACYTGQNQTTPIDVSASSFSTTN